MQNKDEALGTQPIGKLMLSLALPAVAAQFINMLYNIVDRIYIGNIPGTGALALTGVGVTFPIILLVSAFAAFAGMGGAPLASIQLGAGNREGAEKILGNCFSMLLVLSVTLTVIFSIFKTPLLYMFGAFATPSSAMRRTISPFTWRVLFSGTACSGPQHFHQRTGPRHRCNAQRAHRRGH